MATHSKPRMEPFSGAGLTRALAEKALAIRFQDLPAEIVDLAKQCLLDWLGVTIAGASEPLVQILAEQAESEGGKQQASLIGRSEKVSVVQAALVNGAASHA